MKSVITINRLRVGRNHEFFSPTSLNGTRSWILYRYTIITITLATNTADGSRERQVCVFTIPGARLERQTPRRDI